MSDPVVHFEIPTDEPARAKRFYRTVFGWRTSDEDGSGYTLLRTTVVDRSGRPREPGAINGGLLPRRGPVRAPVITIGVDDLEKSLAAVTAHGGVVVRGKEKVGAHGYAAYFRDPEGNVVGLWEPLGR